MVRLILLFDICCSLRFIFRLQYKWYWYVTSNLDFPLRWIVATSSGAITFTMRFRGMQEILKSYLTDQCQYTRVGNAKSSNQKINCGVPQGSTLGPLLFIMYVYDLPSTSEFSTTLFGCLLTTLILYLRIIICYGLNTKLIFNCNSKING